MSPIPRSPAFIKIRIPHEAIFAFGPGKAALLEAIDQYRSISEAGRRMGLSYTKTRRLLDEMNQSFKLPLVESDKGGAGGGGARVTATGRKVLTAFRAMEDRARAAIQEDYAALVMELKPDSGAAPANPQ